MARKYPRFLYSIAENSKSKGSFIIHTLPPRVVFKVWVMDNLYENYKLTRQSPHIFSESDKIALERIEDWDTAISNAEIHKLFSDVHQWLRAQLSNGSIKISIAR